MRAPHRQIHKLEGFYHPAISNNDFANLGDERQGGRATPYLQHKFKNLHRLTDDDISVIRGVRLLQIALGSFALAQYVYVLNDYRRLDLEDRYRSFSIGLIFLTALPILIQFLHLVAVFIPSVTKSDLNPHFPIFIECHVTLSYLLLLVLANPHIYRKHDCLHKPSSPAGLHCDLLSFNYYYTIVLIVSNAVTFMYAASYYRTTLVGRQSFAKILFPLFFEFALYYLIFFFYLSLPVVGPLAYAYDVWNEPVTAKVLQLWYWIGWYVNVFAVWSGIKRVKMSGGGGGDGTEKDVEAGKWAVQRETGRDWTVHGKNGVKLKVKQVEVGVAKPCGEWVVG